MRKRSKPIGEIFVNMGRLTPADVERALAYQREQGGVFGDALVTLGLLTPEEVKWGLADQYDIPFVQLRPENIDWDTAVQVPARWAREHTMLPVLRHGSTVTTVMADPRKMNLLEDVRRFTQAERVEAALSTAETIYALIEAVHGEQDERLISLPGLLAEAMEAGGREFGVSVRGGRVRGWYRAGTMQPRTLDVDWAADLQRMVTPQFLLAGSESVRQWSAVLNLEGTAWQVQCRAIGQGSELEWMAHITLRLASRHDPARVDDGVERLVREQPAGETLVLSVCAASAEVPTEVLQSKLPLLPQLLFEEPRSVHLHSPSAVSYAGILATPLAGPIDAALRELEPFALDALTLDVSDLSAAELNAARRVARLVVFRVRNEETTTLPADAQLCLRADGGELLWTEAAPHYGAD